ncbi:FAD-dependent oxidoreductase [Erwiniaceae bacterium BAC15a-03b]|uniref:FAD-dependent oxidoreductase n=1 Tax=Winslowiella arboricola TaxID=2978220 RepID=A0A9J6PQ23_9GAMM|nr:FAD-dependent oxidoreductase [Winslowiella arboricola]MCU5772079.1 FAD-dependent oxidoreductase [Winslowiella arboricola]MCU5776151.1 FAD-dependent oxidoreductase [Winslowiella arboricola]
MSYQNVMVLQDLPQMKPVKAPVGDTDVLLIRNGESVNAYQASCPHAGAPLEQGAICDDQLICPWHKAVFNLSDGSLAEPLALSHLQRYALRIENGMVQVDPEPLTTTKPHQGGDKTPVFVILGSGAAGSAAAWTLRDEGFNGKLILVDREPEAPYDRTALSKFVPSGNMKISEVPSMLDKAFLQQVNRVYGDVERLDSREQQLYFADGSTLHFDKLLIASGGVPQRPDISGKALFGVHLLRSIEQADTLLKEVDSQQKLVIIGNSFIGMELASALRAKKIDVQVIARQPLPFKAQFGEQIATFFRQLHEENGVRFVEGEVAALQGEQHVSGVQLKSGEVVPADVVLFATGIAPATGFIHDIALLDDGSLHTDAELQVGNNIWAVGDIATYPTADGELRIEHYRVAHQQGRVAAKNMLGAAEAFDRVPFFWTAHFGTRYEYLGHASEWDQFELIGSLAEKTFIAFYGQQGKLVAVASCGMYTLTAELIKRMQQPMTVEQAISLAEQYQ